jgi:hypothetical protein
VPDTPRQRVRRHGEAEEDADEALDWTI